MCIIYILFFLAFFLERCNELLILAVLSFIYSSLLINSYETKNRLHAPMRQFSFIFFIKYLSNGTKTGNGKGYQC